MTTSIHNDPPNADRRFRLLLAVAVAAGLGAGTLAARQARAALENPAAISIDNFTFAPAELTVPVGTTVKWSNRDDIPHSIVGNNAAFRSAALDTDDAYTFTFKNVGTFTYFCGLHPHMTGKVIVKP